MDKHDAAESVFRALPDHGIVTLAGRDALAFAQAQCMNDVAALADGQWQWNGWLTPKGRVIALFALLRRDAETLWLVLPDAEAQAFAAALQRFVFRSKVRIQVRDDLCVTGAFEAPATARASLAAESDPGHIDLDFSGDGGPRTLRIADVAAAGADDGIDVEHVERWKAQDLLHGLARLPSTQREHWTPQQLSLDRMQAYSVRKGCYPGQEIVARTHFLGGAAKRGLVLLALPSAASAGDEVTQADRAVGQLIAVARRATDVLALAVLPVERDAAPLHVGTLLARVEPLQGGLAR